MYHDTIGIIGGFGGYATLDFYKRILEEFSTGNERDYPHIFMDLNFTMPSRTKALLAGFGEEYEEIVNAIETSCMDMINRRVDHIILVCGTAHAFLPEVYKRHPEICEKVIDIIDATREYLISSKINRVLIIAAEGTMKNKVYEKGYAEHGILAQSPKETDWELVRYFIESVKRGKVNQSVLYDFNSFLTKYEEKNILLGCTELPVIIAKMNSRDDLYEDIRKYDFIDPMELAIKKLKAIIR